MQHTEACADCVVTFICSREPDDAVVIDVAEVRALKLLAESGLVPGSATVAARVDVAAKGGAVPGRGPE